MSNSSKHYKTDPELKAELDKYLPPLSEVEYQELKANIALEYDIAKPITLWKERPDTIVDGHHRYRACLELGIEPVVVVKSFKSVNAAVLYALKGSLLGRELTVGQRVIAFLQMLKLEDMEVMSQEAKEQQKRKSGQSNISVPAGPAETKPTNEVAEIKEVAHQIAEKAGVRVRAVYEVQSVKNKGIPEVMGMIGSGTLGTTDASAFVNMVPNKGEQAEIAKGGSSAVRKHVRDAQKAKRDLKKKIEAEHPPIKPEVAQENLLHQKEGMGPLDTSRCRYNWQRGSVFCPP
jgi:hypothetical protein